MNYEQPRQIDGGPYAGKWHYTLKNDDRIYAIGYCSPWQQCTDCEGRSYMMGSACNLCDQQGVVRLDEDHTCPGHDTADEARTHYRAYLFDHKLFLDGEYADAQYRCEVCDAWTTGYADLGHTYMHTLCDAHRTRETMERLVAEIGDSIHS